MSVVVALPCPLLSVAAAWGLRLCAPSRRAIVRLLPDHTEPPGHAEPPGHDVSGRRCRTCRRHRAIMSTVVALPCPLSIVAAARVLRPRTPSRRAIVHVPPGHDMSIHARLCPRRRRVLLAVSAASSAVPAYGFPLPTW